jgi:hypothetical protein
VVTKCVCGVCFSTATFANGPYSAIRAVALADEPCQRTGSRSPGCHTLYEGNVNPGAFDGAGEAIAGTARARVKGSVSRLLRNLGITSLSRLKGKGSVVRMWVTHGIRGNTGSLRRNAAQASRVQKAGWRRERDSNPRGSSPGCFQDSCHKPLGHPSTYSEIYTAGWGTVKGPVSAPHRPCRGSGRSALRCRRLHTDNFPRSRPGSGRLPLRSR